MSDIRTGGNLNEQLGHFNSQGRRGDFHKGEIVSARDAIQNRRDRRPIGGGSGWAYGSKKELPPAPYPAFAFQTVMHIQATHALVTTGIADAANPTGGLVQSQAGWWVAMQDVPGQTTVSGTAVWNLPQLPMPNPDNMDDAKNFWHYLGDAVCF